MVQSLKAQEQGALRRQSWQDAVDLRTSLILAWRMAGKAEGDSGVGWGRCRGSGKSQGLQHLGEGLPGRCHLAEPGKQVL